MADQAFTASDIRALLEQLALPRSRTGSPAGAADAQVEFLIARITLLTDVLRRAESNEATRLASRMLIADLAQLAAEFRGSAHAMGGSLSTALDDLRGALEGGAQGPPRRRDSPGGA